ncbi:MAG TPA: penicillin-binding protein [Bacteroidetes bacterium]|nr:penicillin-binding protein [Bacteroidota bacterium]
MNNDKRKIRKYLIICWSVFAAPFLILALLFILISSEVFGPMPSFEELENPESNLAAEVYSADGVLLGKFYIQNRTWTDYEDISPQLINALVATEDIRFYKHSGIDIRGLGRVVFKTVLLGQRESGGGSTITQQLAKNLFPRDTASYQSSLKRTINLGIAKFKEWTTAVKLERSYTKEEIITMYLNVFDFLYQAVGINSAARIYFNTTPDSLKLEQAAMLVGMAQNPSYYNPVRRPEETMKRRNVVLRQMVKYGYLSREKYDSLKFMPIELDFNVEGHNEGLATYFREYIRTTMIKYKPERENFFSEAQYEDALWEWNNNPLYGWCRKNQKPDGTNYNLYRDGLKIYTTIDSRIQKYAEEAVREHLGKDLQVVFNEVAEGYRNPPFSDDLNRNEVEELIRLTMRRTDRYRSLQHAGVSEDSIVANFNTPVPMTVFSWEGDIDTVMSPLDSIWYYKYFLRSGLMAMEPGTGHVKAYVGGPDIRYFKFDAVTLQKRQAGSTIKPFLYTLAMQDGYSPCHKVPNVPQTFQDNDSTWTPRSSGNPENWGKMVTLRWGLANSENYISAWLMKQFNPESVIDVMRKMGIRSYIDPVNSIFLGTSIMSLYELVGAFNTFANKGVHVQPLFVTRIEDKNGDVIQTFKPRVEEAINEEIAYLMVNLLEAVVKEGTGIRLRYKYELMNQIGGKTGTTQNQSDGWFMGITPQLTAGVWTGWEDRSIHFNSLGLGSGANMALPVFGLFMQKVYADSTLHVYPGMTFEQPPHFNPDILDCEKYESLHNDPARRLDEVIF